MNYTPDSGRRVYASPSSPVSLCSQAGSSLWSSAPTELVPDVIDVLYEN